ncbi:MAG: hypothetical protein R2778_18700 [Saprospiraceae bacterium]
MTTLPVVVVRRHDEVGGTPYGRPEDLEIVGSRLYFNTTSENRTFVIELLDASTA